MLNKRLSIKFDHSNLLRLGPIGDGGYAIPNDLLSIKPLTLISVGIGFDIRFELEFNKYNDCLKIFCDTNIFLQDIFLSELKALEPHSEQ